MNARVLKPCPFCGSAAKLSPDGDGSMQWVHCGTCESGGPIVKPPDGRGCVEDDEMPEMERRACEAWNQRAEPQVVAHDPIHMRLTCPECGMLHIDEGEFATKPHHTHACQKCGLTWRPAIVPTIGVRFLPGFKNAPASSEEWVPEEGDEVECIDFSRRHNQRGTVEESGEMPNGCALVRFPDGATLWLSLNEMALVERGKEKKP